jgi:hypothetical protein
LLASQLRLTLAASVTTLTTPGWLQPVSDAFYLLGSAVFQRMEYQQTTKLRQKTFYFSFFKKFSRANTVNMNAPPLVRILY